MNPVPKAFRILSRSILCYKRNFVLVRDCSAIGTRNGRAGPEPSPPASYGIDAMKGEAESINNFKFFFSGF